MRLSIDKDKFVESALRGPVPPLGAEFPYAAPNSVYPLFSGPMSLLFQSVKGPPVTARYSFIGFDPYAVIKVAGGDIEVLSGDKSTHSSGKPLSRIRELLGCYVQSPDPALPPFQGGAAGLLSYDFVHYLELLPKTTADDLRIPDAHILMLDRLIAFDHLLGRAWAVLSPGAREAEVVPGGPGAAYWAEKYDEAEANAAAIINRLGKARPDAGAYMSPQGGRGKGGGRGGGGIEVVHEMPRGRYTEMVKRAKDYIAAGDIFQANLSQRVHAHLGGADPWEIYRTLSAINPSPFAGFMDFGDYLIVSSSPERLIRVYGSVADTRPIAGTRPRGKDTLEDEALRAELLLNDKERAEHIMLIDLERNDLGKVCDYGSVHVDEFMVTEDYSHVIHIVSNIRGRLAGSKTALDALRATFPGGTITGVPKVRCMEIIDELEPVRRGPYTGSMGYVGFSGAMDMNIIIRTFVIKDGVAYVQAGAGIVADSDPEWEYFESLKKAEALITALSKVN